MNRLILNREFKIPADGMYHVAPLGEFAHAAAGVVQVLDAEACTAMAARFAADVATPNFPGLLIDFDHLSMDSTQRSEAAGWIVGLEARTSTDGNGPEHGLWAQIRWSDVGEEAVKGGRYRFLSPVWSRADCVELGTDPASGWPRMRPVRLLNAAVTNDPNLKGMRPLSNSGRRSATGESVDSHAFDRGTQSHGDRNMKSVVEKLLNHLGLAADATEAVVLEKMGTLPSVSAVADLQNSLRVVEAERDALKATVKTVEGELLNRDLAEFEGVVTETAKGFWTEQLLRNRKDALAALGELASLRDASNHGAGDGGGGKGGETRKPLHNRATARPVIPGVGTPTAETESKAVKIRNRAHEIARGEKVPFSVAFRRAEREVLGNG